MRIKSILKKPCPRNPVCLKQASGAIWAEGELGKHRSAPAPAKPSTPRPDTGFTYGRAGLGGRQQRHGDLGEVIEDEEIQLPSVQQLRHWQGRREGAVSIGNPGPTRPYPTSVPARPARACGGSPGPAACAMGLPAELGAAAAARRARPAPCPGPAAHLRPPCPPRSPRRSRCAPRRPPGARSLR